METILETIQGNIKIVQYNKPKRKNAIDRDMYIRVTKILHESAEDSNIGMMVLTGTGDYYSSGNDLFAAFESIENNLLPVLKEYIHAFITFPKLLVAIVNGPAVGIAATTLPLCDLVFASENVGVVCIPLFILFTLPFQYNIKVFIFVFLCSPSFTHHLLNWGFLLKDALHLLFLD